mgnify:FL=1
MKILAQIGICILLGTIIGIAFWLCDGGKTRQKVSEGQEYEIRGEAMNHLEKYSDRELEEIQKYCVGLCGYSVPSMQRLWIKEIHQIALVEINRELDERKIRTEGRKP